MNFSIGIRPSDPFPRNMLCTVLALNVRQRDVHVETVTCLVASSATANVWVTRRFGVKIQLVVSKTKHNSYVTIALAWKCTHGIYMHSSE